MGKISFVGYVGIIVGNMGIIFVGNMGCRTCGFVGELDKAPCYDNFVEKMGKTPT